MIHRIASPSIHASSRFAFALAASLLALSGCPAEDDDDTGATMTNATTVSTTMDTSGGESSSGSESGSETEVGPVDFETDLQPIFDAECTMACHEPGGTWGSFLDLSPGVAYEQLLEMDATQAIIPFVTPSEPDNSYILYKLRGTQTMAPGGGSGVQMPQAKPPLSDEEIALFEAWIMQGAPE